MAFGKWLREQRLDKGLTMKEFANLCGISYVTLSGIELDKVKAGITATKKIATALEIDYIDLRQKMKEGHNDENQSIG